MRIATALGSSELRCSTGTSIESKGADVRRRVWIRSAMSTVGVLAVVTSACSSARTAAPTPSRTRATTSATTTATATATTTATTAATTTAPLNVYAHTLPGDLSPAVAGVPARVYVPNTMSNTVDVIDPSTYKVIDQFPVGVLPQHVVPSYDLRTLYVNNNRGNSLTPIDPRTGKPGTPIPVDDPYNLYFTPDGTKAIVMAERNNAIDFRDPHTFALIKRLPLAPCHGPNHADFTVDGKQMLLGCEFNGWLMRVDVDTMQVTGELQIGGKPIDVKLSPDGQVFYVANQGRGGVSIIDLAAMHELGFIPTGAGAHGLYPSRDTTKLYVTNRGEGSISVIDFATRRVVAKWAVGGSPDMGGVTADGTQLWLSNRYSPTVSVIDTRTGRLLHTIKVGVGPHGLCVFPQPGRYSLGHTGNYR
jgi:YVTN family beta-propeller protein